MNRITSGSSTTNYPFSALVLTTHRDTHLIRSLLSLSLIPYPLSRTKMYHTIRIEHADSAGSRL